MSWLTESDLEARLRASNLLDLADDDANDVADPAVIAAVIADAESEVESRIGGRYAGPFTSADEVLVNIAAALAIHRLYLRKNSDSPSHVKEAHEAAQALLERIAHGMATLPGHTPEGTLARGTHTVDDREFTRDSLGNL